MPVMTGERSSRSGQAQSGFGENVIGQDALVPAKKEGEGSPIFVARLGMGPHSLKYSDWHIQLGQDVSSYFQPSNSPQRNIFYMEDASGSQSFKDNMSKAYKVYGSWGRAYFWADLRQVWKKLDLTGPERFPLADELDHLVDTKISSVSKSDADSYNFSRTILQSVDEVIIKKGLRIDVETETRRNAQERSSVKNLMMVGGISSAEEMRDWIMNLWNLRKLRDSKIVDDLTVFYKKAYKQKLQTRIYVSLGEGHSGIKELLIQRLGRSPSYDISFVKGSVNPEYLQERGGSGGAIRFDAIVTKAVNLLDSKVQLSNNDWEELYKQLLQPKK